MLKVAPSFTSLASQSSAKNGFAQQAPLTNQTSAALTLTKQHQSPLLEQLSANQQQNNTVNNTVSQPQINEGRTMLVYRPNC